MFTAIFFIEQVEDAPALCCFEPGGKIRELAVLIGRAYIPIADGVFAELLFRGIRTIAYGLYFGSVIRVGHEDVCLLRWA